jgi:hypothetical protein
MKAAAVFLLLAAWQCHLVSAQTSTCSVSITGTPTGGVQGASMACSGPTVIVTGAAALEPFAAKFGTGASMVRPACLHMALAAHRGWQPVPYCQHPRLLPWRRGDHAQSSARSKSYRSRGRARGAHPHHLDLLDGLTDLPWLASIRDVVQV